MAVVAMKQLLEAGVHFGHQTRRWDPKMAEYIRMCKRSSRKMWYVLCKSKMVRRNSNKL